MSGLLKRGTLLQKDAAAHRLAYWHENVPLLADALRRYRVEKVDGEWRIIGKRGHGWEYGRGKIGFSVERSRVVRLVERETVGWAKVTQRGDAEANFCAPWTSPGDTDRLAKVLRFYRRRDQAQKPGSFSATRGVSGELQPSSTVNQWDGGGALK